jgi:hypothetical protein
MKAHCGPDRSSMAMMRGFQAIKRSFRGLRLAGWNVAGRYRRWAVPRTITSFGVPFAGPFSVLGSKIPALSWAFALAAHSMEAITRPVTRCSIRSFPFMTG